MATSFALDNGLQVVFEEQRASKVVAFQVWIKVGSADEREDQAGLAHLHEHMLFKGTRRRGPGQIAHDVEAHGGEINAWTSFDQTVYHLVMASPFARVGLDILADAVRHSLFESDELAREIEVVCEEIKRSEDSPARRASRDLFSTSFQIHPYRRPVIGWEDTVRGFTRDKVLEFYGQHYTPNNMVLVAVGDVDAPSLRSWAQELLGGDWGRKNREAPARPAEPKPVERRTLLRQDDVKEAYLNLGFLGPSVKSEDAAALDVLAMIAGQNEGSRLQLEVKRKRSLVNEIHAFAYTPKDPGLWMTSLTAPAAELPQALEQTVRVLNQLRREPVSTEELTTAQSLVEAEAIYQRETVQGMARKLGFYQSELGDLTEEARYYERVAKLTPEKLLDVASRFFQFDTCNLTGLLPPEASLTPAAASEIVERVSREPHRPFASHKAASARPPLQVMSKASAAGRPGEIIVHPLACGAQIVVREEHAVPLFAARAAYLGGLRYENDSNNGLTTLLSRLLHRGTPTHSAEEISHLLDSLNGAMSGAGGRNSISMRGEFLSKHFDRAFELLMECLMAPTFPEEEHLRERKLLMQDIATREDKPSALAFELFAQTLYRHHPYRLPILGTQACVERLSRENLARYHARHMDPAQLVLCVVGDVRAEDVIHRADAALSHKAQAAAPPPVSQDARPTEPRSAQKTLAKAQSHLVTGFWGLTLSDPQRHALEVLSTVLSGQGGRLFRELRDKHSLAYSVSSHSITGIDPGYFAVYIGTSPEKLGRAKEGIHAELARIREQPVSLEELERAKQHLLGEHEIGLQRNGARAALLALDVCYGLGAQNFLNYGEQINQVTAEDVLRCAQEIIDFQGQVEVVVGP